MPTPPLEPPPPKKTHVLPADARCKCGSQVHLTHADDRYICGCCQAMEIKRLRGIVDTLQPAARSAHSVLCGIMGERSGGRPVDSERVFEVFTILNQAIGPPGTEAIRAKE